jgi:radical SAM-linked protein
MNQALTQQRIRITFGKHGFYRFIGHLDLAKAWERVIRRAELSLEYTQGFNPRPRMQFAAALPVGVTSDNEYLDAWLTERLDGLLPGDWIDRLAATSPTGLRVYDITEVPIRDRALPTLVTHAEYAITPPEDHADVDYLRQCVETLLAAPAIERQRRDKTYDLRPLILDLIVDPSGVLIVRLKTGEQGNARPDELVDALGLDPAQTRIHRRHLYLDDET